MEFEDVVKWCRQQFPELVNCCRDEIDLLCKVQSRLINGVAKLPESELESHDRARLAMLPEITSWLE